MNLTKEKCFVCFESIGEKRYVGFDVNDSVYIRHATCSGKLDAPGFPIPHITYNKIELTKGFNIPELGQSHDAICDGCQWEQETKNYGEPLTADDVLDIRIELRKT